MAKGVPSSFDDLKSRVQERLRSGDEHPQDEIIEMGDSMMQAGVEPKSAKDKVAKNVWQAAGPDQKKHLADMVTHMAKEDDDLM